MLQTVELQIMVVWLISLTLETPKILILLNLHNKLPRLDEPPYQDFCYLPFSKSMLAYRLDLSFFFEISQN